MTETLWTICAWTGLIWWFFVFIAATVITCAAVVEARCAKWEDDEVRRIARGSELRHAARAGEDDLPANWVEKDVDGSFNETWAEIRRRKTGGE